MFPDNIHVFLYLMPIEAAILKYVVLTTFPTEGTKELTFFYIVSGRQIHLDISISMFR